MGRELRRKQAKKEGKSLERVETNENNQIKKYIRTIFLMVVVLAIIYIISGLFITKELKWFNKEDTSTDQKTVSNTILASEVFKQSDMTYYVYFYDFDEEEKDGAITTLVNSEVNDGKVYNVNTKSALNANYVAETGNRNAKTIEDLKVTNHTLIKISEEKITEYYEADEITKKFG